ncbi:MAG: hypothetical protein ACR2FG_08420 [Marmoricola sp.]
MSNSSEEQSSTEGITDDKLPEDLRPTDDNPLAKPVSEDDSEEGGASLPDMGEPGAG